MEAGLVVRVVTTLAAVLLGAWVLTPTFLGKEVQDVLQKHEERAQMDDPPELTEPEPWWVNVLPNLKVNLGLDLQGGIDLTLEVETDEAVLSTVQRDIAPVKAAAEKAGVKLADVKRDRASPALLVAPEAGTELDAVQKLLRASFPDYAYEGTKSLDGKDWFVFLMSEATQAAVAKTAVDQALETIRNRIDETGVKEPNITLKGERGIDVQLPGETNVEQAVAAVGTTAVLEFMLVDEDVDMGNVMLGVDAAKAAMAPDAFLDDRLLSEWLAANGHLPAGDRLMWEYLKENRVEIRSVPVVVKDDVLLSGDDVNDAQTQVNGQSGEYYVALEFKPRGQAQFADITGNNVGKRFAIVLDDKVRSAPSIRERINGTASISMGGMNIDEQVKEAGMLALVLRSGALPAPVTVGEVRTIGASLGEEAIRDGVLAATIGAALVFLYAAFYYRFSGLLADISLAVNCFLVVALLAVVGATLTLPGICGIALTIGMAVDCNIIIFERIREELRTGKGVRAAIEAGFDRAFVAVIDSNVTTLLAGVVLYSYGSGPIKGFAVTLMIGIFTTLFTGVFVSRTLLEVANRGRTTVSI